MSYGNCCLISDIPENTEVVGKYAEWFEKGNVKDLYSKLQYLLNDESIVKEYKDKAASYILSRYDWDKVVDQMLEVYSGNVVEYEDILKRYAENI